MILVTGATGHVGSELVRLLAEAGTPARALIHSPDKAAPIKRLGLETALGDFEQPDTLDAAMAGCDHLFLLSPPSPRQPEQEQNVIDAAKRAGVAHVVKQSVPGADADALIEGNTLLAAGHGAGVTGEVAKLTGRPPRTFDNSPPITG